MTKNMQLLAIGGAGLAVATTLSLVVEDPGVMGGTAIVLIMSLSAALCGAAVPGVIRFDAKPIRAAGAAVFFVVPWVIPAAPVTATAQTTQPGAHEPASTPPAGTDPSGTGRRPPIRIPPPTTKPPERQPADQKPAVKKPAIARPRTIFDGLFSSNQSQK